MFLELVDLSSLVLILLVLFCTGLFLVIRLSFPSQYTPPVVSSQRNTLPYLYTILSGLDEKSVVYDLGSGDGHTVALLSKHFPATRFIGIEKRLAPYIASLFLWRLVRRREMLSFRYKNFFIANVNDATHIYTYLFPTIMDDLLPKFERELAPRTLVISLDFPFSQKEPEQVIDVSGPQRPLFRAQRGQLFVYRF